jgi:hypothetical protein
MEGRKEGRKEDIFQFYPFANEFHKFIVLIAEQHSIV